MRFGSKNRSLHGLCSLEGCYLDSVSTVLDFFKLQFFERGTAISCGTENLQDA